MANLGIKVKASSSGLRGKDARIATMASKMPMLKRNNKDIKDYLNIPTQVMRQGKMIDIAQNNARIFNKTR